MPAIISPTYAEVDLGAIRSNVRIIKDRVAPSKVMAIVKANAYGHGLRGIARVLAGLGVDYFGVSQVREGIIIRDEGLAIPTLILGPLLAEEVPAALSYKLEMSVVSIENARIISGIARKHGEFARVHIKVDTGMGRLGISWLQIVDEIETILKLPHLKIAGIFTHFATADWVQNGFAHEQMNRFLEILFGLEKRHISIPLKHAANSGAILDVPESFLDMVRPGIMLYGYYPSCTTSENIPLEPAMTLRSRVKQVKHVEAGTGISYGLTYKTPDKTTIASIHAGYGDGYYRGLSNKGTVLIRGKRYPVVGTVCMDWIMVNLGGDSNVHEGDEAVLFGRQGDSVVSLWELAELANTIPYELLCNISERVPRVYTEPVLPPFPLKGKSEKKIMSYTSQY